MKNAIETFIQRYRDALDAGNPDAQVWLGVDRTLQRWESADALERMLWTNRPLFDAAHLPESVWPKLAQSLDLVEGENGVDRLAEFIRNNRSEFDLEAAPDRVWRQVEAELGSFSVPPMRVSVVPWRKQLLGVAAGFALLISGIGIGLWYSSHLESRQNGLAMSAISSEYAELESYYQRDIATKQLKLATFTGNQSTEVHEDLDQMDQVLEELRKELGDVPPANREQIVRAMIENYKAKSAILQRVLERLEVSKNETNNSEKKHEIENI